MPTPRVTMQQLKECFRLKFECALSHERIARTLGLSKGVIGKYVSRAQALGLTWATLATWDEAQIVGADPQLTRAPMLGVTRMLGKYASGFRSFCAPVPAHSKIGTSSRNGSVMDRRTHDAR